MEWPVTSFLNRIIKQEAKNQLTSGRKQLVTETAPPELGLAPHLFLPLVAGFVFEVSVDVLTTEGFYLTGLESFPRS